MKKISLLFCLLVFQNSISQIIGQNGSAVNQNGNVITGNISIPANLTVQGMLRVGDYPLYLSQLDLGMEYKSSGISGLYIGDLSNNDVSTYITGWGNDYNAASVIGLTEGEIAFRTFSTDIMRLKNGNVGIKTTSPSYPLDVYGYIGINGQAIADVDTGNGIIKIGDVDGNDAQLALYDNTTSEVVRIANGKVGIGTTNPLYKLDVNGNTRSNIFTTGSTGAGMEYRQYGPEWGLYMGDLTSNDVSIFINGYGSTYEDAASTIRLGDGELYFRTQQQTAMFINDVQNIGIGTLYPTESLHLFQGNLMLESDDYTSLKIKFKDNDLGDMYDFGVDGGSEGFKFDVNSSNKMIIRKNGNVGIGTTDPDEALSVNGTIHAKEVRVDLIGWPDYVFDENYELTPLGDLKKFIETNKHLPNIPAANDIEFNGLNLGNMQTKQMEKIEELTLYIIEQEERIKSLEDLVKELVSEKTSNNKN